MKNNQFSQLVSIVLLLFMILGGVFFVSPMKDNVGTLTTQKDAAAIELQGLQSQYEELAALAAKVSESEATKTKLLRSVPVGTAQDALLDEMTKISEDLKIDMNSISFGKSSDEDFGNFLSVTATFNGSYAQLISFLQKIENAERLMRITTLSVQLTSTTDAVFNLGLEAYYQ